MEYIGKELKIYTNELQYGRKSNIVFAFGIFKNKKTNTNYIIYTNYINKDVIYYAEVHLREDDTILTLKTNTTEETINEIIEQIINKKDLEEYEIIDLNKYEFIELVGYNEIKDKEAVINKLLEITRKVEIKEETQTTTKKTSKLKYILLLPIIVLIIYFVFIKDYTKEEIERTIICNKEYQNNVINSIIKEEKTFSLKNDTLKNSITTVEYTFEDEEDYKDFKTSGTYYKYMPDETKNGGYTLNDEEQTYKYTIKEIVDDKYTLPIEYNEIITYYTKSGYNCK